MSETNPSCTMMLEVTSDPAVVLPPCRMMVFGVLTLILSWTSLGAGLAAAVVSSAPTDWSNTVASYGVRRPRGEMMGSGGVGTGSQLKGSCVCVVSSFLRPLRAEHTHVSVQILTCSSVCMHV